MRVLPVLCGLVLFLAGLAPAAGAAPIGVLDPNSITLATTPRASLANLAYQRISSFGGASLNPFQPTRSIVDDEPDPVGRVLRFAANRNVVVDRPDSGQTPAPGVPEPGAALLFAAGFGAVALRLRRR